MLRRFLFVLVAAAAAAASAQTPLAPPRTPTAQLPPDTLFAQRLRLADRLVAQRQVPDAVALLEALVDQRPGDARVLVRLSSAYRLAGQFAPALALLGRVAGGKEAPDLALPRAELLALTGDTAAAFAAWRQHLAARVGDDALARVVASTAAAGRPHDAAALLATLPADVRATPPVQRALAALDAARGDLSAAAARYLDLLDADPSQGLVVQDSLLRLARAALARAPLRAAVDARLDRTLRRRAGQALVESEGDRLDRAVRLLALRPLAAGLALLDGDAPAFVAHVQAHDAAEKQYRDGQHRRQARAAPPDGHDGQDGRVLVRFARAALDADLLAAADTLYATVPRRYPAADAARDALLGQAAVAEREAVLAGETDLAPHAAAGRAARLLDRFAQAYPDHPATPDALARLGRLLVDGGAPDAARLLDDVQRRFARLPAADAAAFDAARLLVRTGRLDDAVAAFDALATRLGSGDLADRARFEQATALLFLQRVDEAAALLGDLSDRAASDTANDAIELALLVREARADSASTDLARYARARLLLRQGRAAEAAGLLTDLAAEMARSGFAPVFDDVLALRADALRHAGAYVFAAEGYDDLARRFPRSVHADAALLALADLYAGPLQDVPAAVGALERLLDTVPHSLLADDARARLQRLRPR